jgi:MerR family transcriptional regulator, light-induced transcriptional regulator
MTDLREHFERGRASEGGTAAFGVGRISVDDREPRHRRQAAEKLLGLNRTIENNVIPSLVVAHASPQERRLDLGAAGRDCPFDEAATLAEQMLAGDTISACAHIEALRSLGHTLETIYLQLFVPAAIELRQRWNNDLCGFAEVTLALWRLQQLLRHHSVEFRAEAARKETGRRVLLVPTPRETHDLSYAMFGLVLMSEFFRRDGWEAWIEPDSTSPEFAKVVHEQWFDVVEFLVNGDKQLDALASRIRIIRRETPNRAIGIMVYGQVFIEHPELVLQVGADLTAKDARQGALKAQYLVGLTHRC